ATAGYRALVADAAAGIEVTPEEALEIARAAGRTAQQLADDIENATKRHEAQQAFDSRDFDAEVELATAEYRDMPPLVEEATKAIEQAQANLLELTARQSALIAKRAELTRLKEAAEKAYQQAMASTCQVARDPGHPENFKLAD